MLLWASPFPFRLAVLAALLLTLYRALPASDYRPGDLHLKVL